MRDIGFGGFDFFLGHGGHVGVVPGFSQHRFSAGQVGLAAGEAVVLLGHHAGFGMFPGHGAKAVQVAHHIAGRQQGVQFMQSQQLAVQGMAKKGFHEDEKKNQENLPAKLPGGGRSQRLLLQR